MAKKDEGAKKAKRAGKECPARDQPSPAQPDGEGVAAESRKYDRPPHPIAEVFPVMTPEEFSELKRDIVRNGLGPLEHILPDSKILDGTVRQNLPLPQWFSWSDELADQDESGPPSQPTSD